MDKMMKMIADELELDRTSAKALECFQAIRNFEKTSRPQSKRYWKREAERLHKELKQMEKSA
jgi:hypothetical protein